jgi:hypothetical protein
VLVHLFSESIKNEDVKPFFVIIVATYMRADKVYVRCEYGSQFESILVRDYFLSAGIEQEFRKTYNARLKCEYKIVLFLARKSHL